MAPVGRLSAALLIASAIMFSAFQAPGQAPPDPIRAAAVRYIDRQLSDSAFNREWCVAHHFGDCPGGVFIVNGYDVSLISRAADTVRYTVSFDIAGILGISEAAPFFMPRAFVDTVEVLRVGANRQWIRRTLDGKKDTTVRTTARVVRRNFDLYPEDLKLLDSATLSRRR